ncbi:MAG: SRPBCC family protein [Chitinophagaceae bacterium]
MPTIHLTHFIAAPSELVFDLSRHVGLHKEAMSPFREDAVAGTRFGLLEKNETVTWKARHLFRERLLRVKVTEMKKPEMFTDEQLQGDFRMLKHEHYFKPCDNGTIMINLLHFEIPYGIMGRWFNSLYLTRYLKNLLEKRVRTIKSYAESGRGEKMLSR